MAETIINGIKVIVPKIHSLGIGIENEIDGVTADLRADGKSEEEILAILREQYAYPERYEHAPNPKPDSIKITVYELNKIMEINDQRLERIAFAVLCLWKAHGCRPFVCQAKLLSDLIGSGVKFSSTEKMNRISDIDTLGYYGIINRPTPHAAYRDIAGLGKIRPVEVRDIMQQNRASGDVKAACNKFAQDMVELGFYYTHPGYDKFTHRKGMVTDEVDYFKVLIDDPNPRAYAAIKVTQEDGDHLWELYDTWRAAHHKCSNCGKKYAGVNMCPDCAKLGRKRENSVKTCACGRLYVVKNDVTHQAQQCWVCADNARHEH